VICWKRVLENQRAALLQSRLLAVYGTWRREGEVCNLIAGRLEDLAPLLGRLATTSREFIESSLRATRPKGVNV